ncbi:polycystin family receptor for egg jelly-like [Ptychodera flava]|uniref:polycystin family receptor for egg jelly-like n=1 Tax=Ptychodera flava TaxID=63121 RepID=UPI00396A5239
MPSNFTRVQRLSCSAATVCLAMVSNAMFYNAEDTTETLQIGSKTLSLGEVYIALITSFVVLPASITMVTLFKKSRRNLRITATNSPLRGSADSHETASSSRALPGENRRLKFISATTHRYALVVAWLLVFASSFVSTFFLVLNSLQWGPDVSKAWLKTQMTSLAFSATVVDPAKALVFATLFSALLKFRKKPFQYEPDDIYRDGPGKATGPTPRIQAWAPIVPSVSRAYPLKSRESLHSEEV